MRTQLLDIVAHTGAMDFFSTILVSAEEDNATISAMDDARTVVVNGTIAGGIPGFVGDSGMSDLTTVLLPILQLKSHAGDDAQWQVKYKTDGTQQTPVEISVTDAEDNSTRYRLMNSSLVPERVTSKIKNWDIEFKPERGRIMEFTDRSNMARAYDNYFEAITVANDDDTHDLVFLFGSENGSNHSTRMIFQKNVGVELRRGFFWNIKIFSKLLGLFDDHDMKVAVSNKGALKIIATNPETSSVWEYTIAASTK